jgi:hypothetical protein
MIPRIFTGSGLQDYYSLLTMTTLSRATIESMAAEQKLIAAAEQHYRDTALERHPDVEVAEEVVEDDGYVAPKIRVGQRQRQRKRGTPGSPFVPQLAPMVMEKFEDERRERLDRSLRLLRKQPQFADMPIKQIMKSFKHLLDIAEPPTILINPNAPITVHVKEGVY